MSWEKKKILVTVKAYPEKSTRYGQVVCTAGITDDGEWIRLYPVDLPNFLGDDGIKKYDWIEAEVKKATGEKLGRKESHKVRAGSLRILDSSLREGTIDWERRNQIVLSKLSNSIEELDAAYKADKTSLGLIKPKEVVDFFATKDLELIKERMSYQETLSGGKIPIMTQIPHIFKYKFRCNACKDGKEHNISCEDWELLESYRKWGIEYNDVDILWEKIYQKYYTQLYQERELYFYIGMFSLQPSWLIIGLYYPPKLILSNQPKVTLLDY